MSVLSFLQGPKRSLMDRLRGVNQEEEQIPGSDAHVNGTPAAEDRPSLAAELNTQALPQMKPSLRDELISKPSIRAELAPGASRLDQLQSKYDAVGAPPTTFKGKLKQSLATVLPTVAGAIFGGSSGATGATEGTLETLDTQRQSQATERKSLREEMEAERQRNERMGERQLTADTARQTSADRLAQATATNSLRQDLADSTNQLKRDIAAATDTTKRRAQDASLREKGFKFDADGNPVALDRTELSPKQLADLETTEALTAYRQAQKDHAQAQAEFERTKNDPKSPAFQQAQQRLNITAQRLDLSKQQFEMRAFGTNQGEALPGSMIADNGQAVGTAFQVNVRPTGAERGKADLANSAHEQLGKMKSIVQSRPDIFGPIEGRTTDFSVWVGSQDPDAQRFRAARTIAGDHLAGVFGGRSEAALSALDEAIGHFKDNPEAVLAGLDQLDKANDSFIKAGTVRTTGSTAEKKQAVIQQRNKITGADRYSTDGGKTWHNGKPPNR